MIDYLILAVVVIGGGYTIYKYVKTKRRFDEIKKGYKRND